ncbi:MAG: hypothetical protein WC603_01325 [Candidatus Paceibacterota bacterium]|jgi:hypothetical protein
MDQLQLQQKIAEYFEKLPKEVQGIFSSMTWMETLKNISTKYNLNEKQVEIIGTETTLVLLGIIHLEEYVNILHKELSLNEEVFNTMIDEIDNNIFKTIKNQLVDTYEANVSSLDKENDNEEKLDERFIGLPEEVREAIIKSNWKKKLYEIASKYKLNIEQMGILEDMTVKVMTNAIHPDKYEGELTSKITISKEDISNLIKDVNENILRKIRNIMEIKTETKIPEVKDEVPLPPYAISSKQEVARKKEEGDSIPVTPKIEAPVDNSKNIMSIVEEKLKSATMSDHTISDYSAPKVNNTPSNNPNPSIKSSDPYREAF